MLALSSNIACDVKTSKNAIFCLVLYSKITKLSKFNAVPDSDNGWPYTCNCHHNLNLSQFIRRRKKYIVMRLRFTERFKSPLSTTTTAKYLRIWNKTSSDQHL